MSGKHDIFLLVQENLFSPQNSHFNPNRKFELKGIFSSLLSSLNSLAAFHG